MTDTLDLGCGLGNLSIEAARRGASVTAVDASPTAVERIRRVAESEHLQLEAILADVESYAIDKEYDTVVAIGLLMFFRKDLAFNLLRRIKGAVKPGGRAIINVLIEGTTFMGMFDPQNFHLFGSDDLERLMPDWTILLLREEAFEAPGSTKKVFTTIIAERPSE